ncbi:hypothetical protein V2J09_019668 [Rumex salicifolius]
MSRSQSDRLAVSPFPLRTPSITPGARVLDISSPLTAARTPHSDESIWRRLRDSGLDEESIKRRDKAALIAYIAKLEAEIYDLQHNMGLLILERKDWQSKYDEAKLSLESSSVYQKRDQAAISSAIAEAKKREDNLKKALGIEKECVANLEKALHEMRVECAEVKVAAESKMAVANKMIEDAQMKLSEAKIKFQAGESLQDEAGRYNRTAERKLHEVEAREDDLRRRIMSFTSDCEAREKEMMLERDSLSERQKSLSQAQEKLLDSQALLNRREADMLNRSHQMDKLQKELEAMQENISVKSKHLMEKESDLDLKISSLSEREKVVHEKEATLNKKEQELLASLEKNAAKEQNDLKRLLAQHENTFKMRMAELELELVEKRMSVEEELESKRRAWELNELNLKLHEDLVNEKLQDADVQSKELAEKDRYLEEKMRSLNEKESRLNKAEKEMELQRISLQREQEEFDSMKHESLQSLEERRRQINSAETTLEGQKVETTELLLLETKLKEEIDLVRAQKLELEAEADKLKIEKAKFESEWELIDEKREELRREKEYIDGEKSAILKYLKDERDSLNLEKAALRDQYKLDLESLTHDREMFLREIQHERSEWFTKIQKEHDDFLLDIELRKKELEDCAVKRREEIESYLKEKEKELEEEKKKELDDIRSLKEAVVKEQEQVNAERRRLETERLQVSLDHDRSVREWEELTNLIKELEMQRQKLKKQREMLQADRKFIYSQIEHLEKLEDLKMPADNFIVSETEPPTQDVGLDKKGNSQNFRDEPNAESASPPGSSFSWIKHYASKILNSPNGHPLRYEEKSSRSAHEDDRLRLVKENQARLDGNNSSNQMVVAMDAGKSSGNANVVQLRTLAPEEPKVIHEVPSISDNVDSEIQRKLSDNLEQTSNAAHRKRKDYTQSGVASDDDALLDVEPETVKKRKQNEPETENTPGVKLDSYSNRVDTYTEEEETVISYEQGDKFEVELNVSTATCVVEQTVPSEKLVSEVGGSYCDTEGLKSQNRKHLSTLLGVGCLEGPY